MIYIVQGVAGSTLPRPSNPAHPRDQQPIDIFTHFSDQSTLPRITTSNLVYSTLPRIITTDPRSARGASMRATLPNFSMEGILKHDGKYYQNTGCLRLNLALVHESKFSW